ncbi:hypothetical protein JF732_25730 [Mycobacterium intracellulare]|uniref:Uncharacterized protein n=1 Tax=Mycobacterium intracellulare TaxID=1767 RepID=A0AAE4RL18_MYCIT|nr:hypothetical protein [Mycobacterium intracellulare]MCA2323117.1 hypothetical protein [Mycobacterium intracellulare]MCA2343916.1 hypothetical protein [Mycobacterium intracellulare]MDV6979771.1 hypothetical protein [Mycobacterium intracellulare]MDV6985795.1 hypothetical protein [Mycobacterium intracellulare]MDV7016193.1 hypothetical protein [Mycobacterium intracellulare]
MTEQTSTAPTPSKKRGVAFPQLTLEAAVEAIVAMGQHGADHSQDAAAAYLGHSTTNSGAYRVKLAALRDWGLIKRGDKERVILSDLARDLVMEAPDHAHARSLLLAAFDSCRVFEQLYEDSAKNIPQDMGRFRTAVVMRHGVATDQADRFIDIFVDSAGYAGLAKKDGSQVTLLPRDRATTVLEDQQAATRFPNIFDVNGNLTATKAPVPPLDKVLREAGAVTAPAQSAIPVALRQSWPIDGGEIEFVIRTPKALPPSIYAVMAEMAEVAAKMEALLKPAPVEVSAPSPVGDDG